MSIHILPLVPALELPRIQRPSDFILSTTTTDFAVLSKAGRRVIWSVSLDVGCGFTTLRF